MVDEYIADKLREGEPAMKVFGDLASLQAWGDQLEAFGADIGLELDFAVDATHCSVVVFARDQRPMPARLNALLNAAAAEFHTFYGPGVCGVTEH